MYIKKCQTKKIQKKRVPRKIEKFVFFFKKYALSKIPKKNVFSVGYKSEIK